jgi:hypothetical protein
MRYQRNSNGYPYIFDHAVLTGDTADIARRRPTTEIQNGGLPTGSTRISVMECDINEIPTAAPQYGMVENVGVAVGISLISHSIPKIRVGQPTSGLQSTILNFGSRSTSGNVGSVTGEYGMATIWGYRLEFR